MARDGPRREDAEGGESEPTRPAFECSRMLSPKVARSVAKVSDLFGVSPVSRLTTEVARERDREHHRPQNPVPKLSPEPQTWKPPRPPAAAAAASAAAAATATSATAGGVADVHGGPPSESRHRRQPSRVEGLPFRPPVHQPLSRDTRSLSYRSVSTEPPPDHRGPTPPQLPPHQSHQSKPLHHSLPTYQPRFAHAQGYQSEQFGNARNHDRTNSREVSAGLDDAPIFPRGRLRLEPPLLEPGQIYGPHSRGYGSQQAYGGSHRRWSSSCSVASSVDGASEGQSLRESLPRDSRSDSLGWRPGEGQTEGFRPSANGMGPAGNGWQRRRHSGTFSRNFSQDPEGGDLSPRSRASFSLRVPQSPSCRSQMSEQSLRSASHIRARSRGALALSRLSSGIDRMGQGGRTGQGRVILESIDFAPFVGRAGYALLFFICFGLEFKNVTLPRTEKSVRERKAAIRKRVGDLCPAHWPICFYDSFAMSQPTASLRYLAIKEGLYANAEAFQPQTDYLADQLIEQLAYWRDIISNMIGEVVDGFQSAVSDWRVYEQYLSVQRPFFLLSFERLLQANDADFSVADAPTWTDPALYSVLHDDAMFVFTALNSMLNLDPAHKNLDRVGNLDNKAENDNTDKDDSKDDVSTMSRDRLQKLIRECAAVSQKCKSLSRFVTNMNEAFPKLSTWIVERRTAWLREREEGADGGVKEGARQETREGVREGAEPEAGAAVISAGLSAFAGILPHGGREEVSTTESAGCAADDFMGGQRKATEANQVNRAGRGPVNRN